MFVLYYQAYLCPIMYNQDHDNCNLSPETAYNFPNQLIAYFNEHEKLNKVYFTAQSIIYCNVFCIFNVLMTSMGQLSVELTASLNVICPELNNSISGFFCSKCQYRTKHRVVEGIMIFYFLLPLGLVAYNLQ
jgi:hypothetical protein